MAIFTLGDVQKLRLHKGGEGRSIKVVHLEDYDVVAHNDVYLGEP